MGSLMTSSSSAGPIQISEFPEPWFIEAVLSLLLFIIVLGALSYKFCSGIPWEDLYASDLLSSPNHSGNVSGGSCFRKKQWRRKGLRVNAGKTKIMICVMELDLLQSSGEFPCAVCHTGVGSNSIFCNGCKHWVHKKCSGLDKGPWLQKYTVSRNCLPFGGQTTEESPSRTWQAGDGSFLLLPRRHALSNRWLWTVNHNMCESRLEEVKELLPVLSSCHFSFKTCGHVYNSCIGSAMLHASETWPITKSDLKHLQQNDRAMIRQICNVKPQDSVAIRPNELLAQLGIEDLDLILKERRLCWYGHVKRSKGAVKTACDIQVDGKCGPRRPKKTWKQLTERDHREGKLSTINPHDRHLEIWCEICHVCCKPVTTSMLPLYLLIKYPVMMNMMSDSVIPRFCHSVITAPLWADFAMSFLCSVILWLQN